MTRTRKLLLALLLVPVLVLGSLAVAQASIPDADTGEITACYKTNGDLTRVIDTDDPEAACPSGQTPLTWNQTGPAGPQGPQGEPGTDGCTAGPWVPLTIHPDWVDRSVAGDPTRPPLTVRHECGGVVRLRGGVQVIDTTGPSSPVAATLPAGYCPAFVHVVLVFQGSVALVNPACEIRRGNGTLFEPLDTTWALN